MLSKIFENMYPISSYFFYLMVLHFIFSITISFRHIISLAKSLSLLLISPEGANACPIVYVQHLFVSTEFSLAFSLASFRLMLLFWWFLRVFGVMAELFDDGLPTFFGFVSIIFSKDEGELLGTDFAWFCNSVLLSFVVIALKTMFTVRSSSWIARFFTFELSHLKRIYNFIISFLPCHKLYHHSKLT